jgi:uncharacterized protein (DUF58 family)
MIRPRLEVRRDVVPQRISEGESADALLTVTNLSTRRSPAVVARDAVGTRRVSISIPSLASGESFTTAYPLEIEERGRYDVGPLAISHSDPLRLVQFGEGVGAQTECLVHPRIVRISPLPTGRSQEIDGASKSGAPRGGITFHSLRDYSPGDDLRLIHWRSTARVGSLMVRHTVITNEPRLTIVLDTHAPSYATDAEFDDAVRIAASMIAAGAEHRFPVAFHTTSGESGSVDPTGRGRTAVFDLLAGIERSDDDPGLGAMGRLSTRREHGVSLGVVTGVPDRRSMATVGRVVGRYEMVTVVQIGDPLRHPVTPVAGTVSVAVEDLDQFVVVWKARVG